jgi:hypothetical protein
MNPEDIVLTRAHYTAVKRDPNTEIAGEDRYAKNFAKKK